MAQLTAIDFFAGCGGLSLGLVQSGINVRWANELNADAAETHRLSLPGTKVFGEDISTFLERLVSRGAGLPLPGDADLVVGGPPCQGFSGYNRHRRADDPRNSLVEVFLDAIAYLKPRYVLLENVPGMLSLEKGKTPRLLLSALESLGYATRLSILQAGYYGVPQNRWRVFIVGALRPSELPQLPQPVYAFPRTTIFGATAYRDCVVRPPGSGADLLWNPLPTATVENAIADLPEIGNGGGSETLEYAREPIGQFQQALRGGSRAVWDHQCPRLGELMLERCKAVPKRPGAGWVDLPDHLKPKNLLRHGDNRYKNRFGRLHWGGVFNTILTKPEPYWGAVFHPTQDRVISVRECARAQGIPDSVHFIGSLYSKYEQVGNAVPPPLGRALGLEFIRAAGNTPLARAA